MSDTDALLNQVSQGDKTAISRLLDRHRDRLRHMVSVRMDPRAQHRFDPSDVVQEGLADACQKLPEYARERPLPFYPWLRKLVWERLVYYHRLHIHAQRRAVDREDEVWYGLSEHSATRLVQQLVASDTSPSARFDKRHAQGQVRQTLKQLTEPDREVLVLRFLEQLTVGEVAAVLGISPKAVGMRQLRAMQRLQSLMK